MGERPLKSRRIFTQKLAIVNSGTPVGTQHNMWLCPTLRAGPNNVKASKEEYKSAR